MGGGTAVSVLRDKEIVSPSFVELPLCCLCRLVAVLDPVVEVTEAGVGGGATGSRRRHVSTKSAFVGVSRIGSWTFLGSCRSLGLSLEVSTGRISFAVLKSGDFIAEGPVVAANNSTASDLTLLFVERRTSIPVLVCFAVGLGGLAS
jgi:hypothetical protein